MRVEANGQILNYKSSSQQFLTHFNISNTNPFSSAQYLLPPHNLLFYAERERVQVDIWYLYKTFLHISYYVYRNALHNCELVQIRILCICTIHGCSCSSLVSILFYFIFGPLTFFQIFDKPWRNPVEVHSRTYGNCSSFFHS